VNERNGDSDPRNCREEMIERVCDIERRKVRSRQRNRRDLWFALGTMGMVGWSIVIPTLIGVAVGIWVDRNWPASFSFTLTLMLGGLAVGCLNAWFWLSREQSEIERERRGRDE
jgi:ATP synthase protein I